jgi:hypothetical protein
VGAWRKSSYSVNGGNCAEVAVLDRAVAVRDSALGGGSPVLKVTPKAWGRLLGALRLPPCECGAPPAARGKCMPCYGRWHSKTNPYRKRGRPRSAMDEFVRRELARRRAGR